MIDIMPVQDLVITEENGSAQNGKTPKSPFEQFQIDFPFENIIARELQVEDTPEQLALIHQEQDAILKKLEEQRQDALEETRRFLAEQEALQIALKNEEPRVVAHPAGVQDPYWGSYFISWDVYDQEHPGTFAAREKDRTNYNIRYAMNVTLAELKELLQPFTSPLPEQVAHSNVTESKPAIFRRLGQAFASLLP